MNNYRKFLVCFLFLVVFVSAILEFAEATTMNFTVSSGEEETKTIDLAFDDRVLIEFTVFGQSENTLDFSISYPNGTVKAFGNIAGLHLPFVCDLEGEYVLRFSNLNSSEDRLVTLNYEIEHYIFGMPQMLFLTIVIAMVCVAAVAVFILMGKPR
jgi:hypothetical protein